MPAGGGAGASTAALIAIAKLAGETDIARIADACFAVEGASDPIMFDQAHRRLWASRLGKTVTNLPDLPNFEVIGGFYGAPERTRADDNNFPDISDLVAQWPGANVEKMAYLATTSARRTLALRGFTDDPTDRLAKELGGLGWIIAHTGSARGVLFAKHGTPPHARGVLIAAGFRNIVTFKVGT
jgi:uncharacterized protein involved in propanediol utilization